MSRVESDADSVARAWPELAPLVVDAFLFVLLLLKASHEELNLLALGLGLLQSGLDVLLVFLLNLGMKLVPLLLQVEDLSIEFAPANCCLHVIVEGLASLGVIDIDDLANISSRLGLKFLSVLLEQDQTLLCARDDLVFSLDFIMQSHDLLVHRLHFRLG